MQLQRPHLQRKHWAYTKNDTCCLVMLIGAADFWYDPHMAIKLCYYLWCTQKLSAQEKFQPGFSFVCLTEQVCIRLMWVTSGIACRHSCCDLLTCSFSSMGYLDLCKSLKAEIKYKSGMRQTTLKSHVPSLPPARKPTDLSLILKTCLQSRLKQYKKFLHECMCTFISK